MICNHSWKGHPDVWYILPGRNPRILSFPGGAGVGGRTSAALCAQTTQVRLWKPLLRLLPALWVIWSCLQDEEGRWNKYGGRLPWGTKAICCNNATFGGTGNHKTGEDYVAAPNIDHTQEFVRRDITKWLKLLRSIGFDGFRFDFVKGYSAPCAPARCRMTPSSTCAKGCLCAWQQHAVPAALCLHRCRACC